MEKQSSHHFSLKKNWLNILMILISVGILIGFICSSDFPALLQLVWNSRGNWYFLVCATLCMVVFWLMEGLCVHILLRRYQPGCKFSNTLRTVMIGQFFNQTTPFATGGQPMQAYAMSKAGIGVGTATSVLIIRFLVYQSVTTLYGVGILAFFYGDFADTIPAFGLWVAIGVIASSALVVLVILLLLFPKFTVKTAHWLIHLLARVRLVKKEEALQKKTDDELNQFFHCFPMLKKNIDSLLWMMLFTFIQLTAMFSIPFFVYLAFSPDHAEYFKMVSATGFVTLIASYFPTPGATGASEFSFYAIFAKLFTNEEAATATMLIWRFHTFYLPIIAGSGFAWRLGRNKAAEQQETLKTPQSREASEPVQE